MVCAFFFIFISFISLSLSFSFFQKVNIDPKNIERTLMTIMTEDGERVGCLESLIINNNNNEKKCMKGTETIIC